jgi:hypothetical protein
VTLTYYIMEAAASSAKSRTQNVEPSINLETVPDLAHKSEDNPAASLIQDLQAQVRELQGRASEDAARIQTLEAQVHMLKSSGLSEKKHDVNIMPSRVCPAQLTEEAISALPMSLPALELEDPDALVACAASYSKQKLRLWRENDETDIDAVGRTPSKSAHRQWLSFLKRQHAVTVAGSVERKTAAVKILQCKGLMVTHDASTEEADGEPLIYAAAADGWSLEDLQVMTCASCSAAARSV